MSAIAVRLIGRSDEASYGQRERSWWVGKPWRRIELNVFGEAEFREWELNVNLGCRRFGWHWSASITRSFYDYSEEPNQ